MRRGLTLYGLWLLGWWHRLRHDLGRELTVVAASLIMFGTFLYVFNDFLNVQIASIAMAMRAAFANTLTVACLILSWGVAIYWIQRRDPRSVAKVAQYLGEDKRIIILFQWLRALTVVACWHGAAWWLSVKYLARWTITISGVVEILMLAGSGFAVIALARLSTVRIKTEQDLASVKISKVAQHYLAPRDILTQWRLTHIFYRSRLCRLLLLMVIPFVSLITISAFSAAPLFVECVSALAAGYLLAATLNVQMAADLRHAWLERGLGVSHDDFMRAYQRVAGYLAIAIGIISGAAYIIGRTMASDPLIWSSVALAALRVASVAAVPALITPSLLLQVDGRRLSVTLPLGLIVCLFVGTGVIAHWLGLALIPILISTARTSQAGRFYRA